jgi:hypothetical protein
MRKELAHEVSVPFSLQTEKVPEEIFQSGTFFR